MKTTRKNKPGAGRPKLGRTVNLPRITVEAHAMLKAHAERTGKGIAATIEEAAQLLIWRGEVEKALQSANDAQKAFSNPDHDWALYYVNGVQDRLKRILRD